MNRPWDMGAPKVEAFLTHLAVELKVAASTQNQAFCALLFLYHYVLRQAAIQNSKFSEPGTLDLSLKSSSIGGLNRLKQRKSVLNLESLYDKSLPLPLMRCALRNLGI